MKKYNAVLLSLLLGGCVTTKKEERTCIDYSAYPQTKEECVGGRGVAPLICVQKTYMKPFCVRYAELITMEI
jgi:hypothetical protein